MIPKILEFDGERLVVTEGAYGIPEVKAILDKYDMKAEPYLMYVRQMSSPESPYLNRPEEEVREEVIYDVINSVGDFDIDEPLLESAIQKLKSLWESPLVLMAKEMDEELHRLRIYLRTTPVTSENMKERTAFMQNVQKIMKGYLETREEAKKEVAVQLRGENDMGEYD